MQSAPAARDPLSFDPKLPLKGLSAILVSPTYGGVDPICAQSLRVAAIGASARGLRWAGDASNDRLGYSFTRNLSARVLRVDPSVADGIMWVDSDIRVPSDAITRLLITVRAYNLDFVSGVYHARKHPFLPVIYHWDATVGQYLQAVDYPEDQVLSLDACGFGFVWTSTRTINAIADSSDFSSKHGWFPDRRDAGGYGEDISFCVQAKKAGIQLYLDTGVQVDHQGDIHYIAEADFRALHLTLESEEVQGRPTAPDWAKK